MPYKPELVEEINILIQFNLSTSQEGIKVHSDAEPSLIAATKRLFDKGFITQSDGGYLTSLGREAAEHAQSLHQVLTAPAAISTG